MGTPQVEVNIYKLKQLNKLGLSYRLNMCAKSVNYKVNFILLIVSLASSIEHRVSLRVIIFVFKKHEVLKNNYK